MNLEEILQDAWAPIAVVFLRCKAPCWWCGRCCSRGCAFAPPEKRLVGPDLKCCISFGCSSSSRLRSQLRYHEQSANLRLMLTKAQPLHRSQWAKHVDAANCQEAVSPTCKATEPISPWMQSYGPVCVTPQKPREAPSNHRNASIRPLASTRACGERCTLSQRAKSTPVHV